MIDYIHKDLYWQDSIDKQLKIELEDGTILDNSMIYSEEFELEESLCSEDELRFGACEASCVKFRIFSIPNRLVGQNITISEVLGGQTDSPMQIGKYKIASAKPTADRDFIDIVAYDVMYDIIHSDVAAWYNNQFKATTSTTTDEDGNETTVVTYSTTTLKKFRDSFFSHFGIEQVDITLPNDGMVVSKTIEIVPNEDGTIVETLSGSTVIEAICELNGCFGHINRDGKFEYVTLQAISKELFPADDLFPRNDLYPASDNTGVVIYNWQYEATEYEDFDVQPITQVQIIQEDNDIGMTVGSDGNKYIINSNFLTYSLSDAELETVGTNLLSVIEKAKYTPIKANVIGNPCVTVGDIIKIVTNSAILYSYVINRSLKGCQSLTDEFESNGEEYRSVDVNSTSGQIKKLQGRSNVLERSIDGTRSTIANVEKVLKSEIKQTAESITSEVERATSEEQKLSSNIKQTAESITSTVAESTKQWDTVDSNGNAVSIKQSGYGFDGSISGGDSYVYSDSMVEDDIYLDQKLGYGWVCKGTDTINGRRVALFGYMPRYVFSLITSNLSSEIKQTANEITSIVSSTQSKWDVRKYEENGWKIIYGTSAPSGISPSGEKELYVKVDTGDSWNPVYDAENQKYIFKYNGPLKKTTETIQSSIEQTANEIKETVSKSAEKYDTGNYEIQLYGFGGPVENYLSTEHSGEYYLDQETGRLFLSEGSLGWKYVETLKLITDNLSSSIKQTAESIRQEVSETYTTKTESYAAKKDLQSSIEQTANEIKSTVSSATSKYDTTGYTVDLYGYGNPQENYLSTEHQGKYYLDQETGRLFLSEGTKGWGLVTTLEEITDELYSQIEQTEESITSTIASSQNKYDTEGYIIQLYGYGKPQYSATEHSREYYLDQSTGKLYVPQSGTWVHTKTFDLITEELSSRIEQTISSISLTVNNGDSTAGIIIELKNEDGTTSQVSGTINMTGVVTFTDLEESGSTVVNGDNITTGTIDAEKVNVINVVAESVAAENITGEIISGKTLNGGNIVGTTINAANGIKMYCMYNALDGGYEPVMQSKLYSGGKNLLVIGNTIAYTAFEDVPYVIRNENNSTYVDPLIKTINDSTLGTVDYFNLGSKSGTPYINVGTTFKSYGITIWESDTKLKKNIGQTEETAMDKIKQIEFIQFDWKDSGTHVPLGVSANQLEEIIPQAVYNVKQPEESEYDSLKNIDTTSLISYSLKAIQELSEVVDSQREEIDTLKQKLATLTERMDRYEQGLQ